MAHHHRTAAIILALGLAVGVPAAAAAQQPATPSSPASPSPCSEVCSGGGYGSGTSTTTQPTYSIPMILNNVGNPAPCSEVCSGGGYGLVSQPPQAPDDSSAYHAARTAPTAVRVVTPSASAGFHWGDAGIGAGAMLALILIGLGGALTLTHRRNQRVHG